MEKLTECIYKVDELYIDISCITGFDGYMVLMKGVSYTPSLMNLQDLESLREVWVKYKKGCSLKKK